MQALQKLLEDNSDPSNTRYNILTLDEISEIVERGKMLASREMTRDECVEEIQKRGKRIKELEEECGKLREAWDKYGQHGEYCDIYFGAIGKCDCGWDKFNAERGVRRG